MSSLYINNIRFNGVSSSIKVLPSCFHNVDHRFNGVSSPEASDSLVGRPLSLRFFSSLARFWFASSMCCYNWQISESLFWILDWNFFTITSYVFSIATVRCWPWCILSHLFLLKFMPFYISFYIELKHFCMCWIHFMLAIAGVSRLKFSSRNFSLLLVSNKCSCIFKDKLLKKLHARHLHH